MSLESCRLRFALHTREEAGGRVQTALALLPVQWLSLLPVAWCPPLSGRCLRGSLGTGATGQLPPRSPGMVAAFNAPWWEDLLAPLGICSLWPGTESLLKSRFCDFSQLTQESGERWPVFWFLEREEKNSVMSLYLCVIANSKANQSSTAVPSAEF